LFAAGRESPRLGCLELKRWCQVAGGVLGCPYVWPCVALVGASLGGAVAVTAARTTKPDAIVDLSGGAKEEQSDIEADAEYVTMPAMFAFSHSDQADLAAVRAELKSMPTKRKVFLTYDDGHGYTLLSDLTSGEFTSLATRVANWVKSS
jgi:dienelactone hydrolase